jgi:hypothetical protein
VHSLECLSLGRLFGFRSVARNRVGPRPLERGSECALVLFAAFVPTASATRQVDSSPAPTIAAAEESCHPTMGGVGEVVSPGVASGRSGYLTRMRAFPILFAVVAALVVLAIVFLLAAGR